MWNLIVLVPDHCLSFYFEVLLQLMQFMWLQVVLVHMALNAAQANLTHVLLDLCTY